MFRQGRTVLGKGTGWKVEGKEDQRRLDGKEGCRRIGMEVGRKVKEERTTADQRNKASAFRCETKQANVELWQERVEEEG